MKKQFDERNLTMVMDFYELTMANGYFKDADRYCIWWSSDILALYESI